MTARAVIGAEPGGGFYGAWAVGAVLLDEIVALTTDPETLERCLAAIRPGGTLRVVAAGVPWLEVEARMLEGGWATIVPVSPGSTLFGSRPEDGSPPPICAYDDPGCTLAEGRR